MLVLTFHVGEERLALEARDVVEVLPLLNARRMASPAIGVVGTFDYRGTFVRLIDLSATLSGRAAAARLSTRIILVRVAADASRSLVGLIAENATEMLQCDAADRVAEAETAVEASYRGAIFRTPRGIVQLLDLQRLLLKVLPRTAAPVAAVA
jgi:chemotaxis-related protein WspB